MYPDFLIIGAQKAGTTWLHRNLQSHPGIWMPREKELHYFDEKIKQEGGLLRRLRGDGPANRRWRRQAKSRFKQSPKKLTTRDVAWDLRYFFGRPGNEWYASLFEQGRGKTTGETTPDYSILEPARIARVHEVMPDAKIIFMMRSPLERPWSMMDMGLRLKGQSWENMDDWQIFWRFDNKRSRLMTDYLRTLENWGKFYSEESIFVGFLEDVHFFPEDLLGRLYSFLGVDTSAGYRIITRRIHSGQQEMIPTRFAVRLAEVYREELSHLADHFGGYASFWRHCAERLVEDPPVEERLAYPLFESRFWKEWEGSDRVSVQSGSLASVRAAYS